MAPKEATLTSDHVADFHQVVVHYIGKMIGRQIVSALVEDFVVQDIALYGNLATQHVVDYHGTSRLDLESDYIFCPVGNQFVYFLFIHRQ